MTSDGEKPMTEQLRRKIEDEINSLSSRALRVLALAEKSINSDTASGSGLVFLGLAAMQDPPREEAKEAIRKCAGAKIKTVMITGDHKETAVAIAKQAGLLKGGKAVTGAELDAMSDVELDRRLDEFTVYARVNPSHKLRLVKAYKRKGHIVTMTGDGVNDAPAVKEADVGVAMGITGTDVTKQAADVILLDDNFATLVKCRRAGQRNIREYKKICKISSFLQYRRGNNNVSQYSDGLSYGYASDSAFACKSCYRRTSGYCAGNGAMRKRRHEKSSEKAGRKLFL